MTQYRIINFAPSKQQPPRNGLFGLGYPLIFLKPNRNDLTEEEYNRIKKTPAYQKNLKWGAIQELDTYTKDEEKATDSLTEEENQGLNDNGDFISLTSLSITEAKKEASKETDLKTLESWLKAEESEDKTRDTVIAILKTQINKVKQEAE